MKFEYKDIFKKTRQIVNDWDPCSFIDAGAPNDEYDALTNQILSGVVNRKEINSLREEIIDLFDNYYGYPVFDELSIENQERLKNEINILIDKIKSLIPTNP